MITASIFLFLESIGGGELMMIMVFILLFFGSKKIPDLARGLGRGMREMKDAMNGVQDEIKQGITNVEKQVEQEPAELPSIAKHPLSTPVNKPASETLAASTAITPDPVQPEPGNPAKE